MAKYHPDYLTCPMATTQQVVGGKWKILILWHLREKPKRFGELQRELPGITQAMLTGQLRELEGNRMINRKVFAEVPPHVEYSLTTLGDAFKPVLESILQWGKQYIEAAQ